MKYLKSFNESLNTNSWLDKEFSSPEEIAKLIDSYFRDYDYSNLMQNMEELLSNVNPDGDFFDLTRYANILQFLNISTFFIKKFNNYKYFMFIGHIMDDVHNFIILFLFIQIDKLRSSWDILNFKIFNNHLPFFIH